MSYYGDEKVKCPFYLSKQNDRHIIKCEGPEKKTTTQIACAGEKGWYIRKFCSGDYRFCRVYKMLNEKYPISKKPKV